MHRSILLVVVVLLCFTCFAQVSSIPPEDRQWCAHISAPFLVLNLSSNSWKTIQQELFDTNTIRLIAFSHGLSDSDLKTVQIAPSAGYGFVDLYQIGDAEKAFKILEEQLRNYAEARSGGHMRGFVMDAITNRTASLTNADPGLRAIAAKRPMVAVSWLTKADSGTTTNKAGEPTSVTRIVKRPDGKPQTRPVREVLKADEVCRWVEYTVSEGAFGWRYLVMFKADGSLDWIQDETCDAKELDPKYQKAIKEVENEVRAEMKRDGVSGLGSVHTFWRLKKEKLDAKEIEWRSPSELNPNSIFD